MHELVKVKIQWHWIFNVHENLEFAYMNISEYVLWYKNKIRCNFVCAKIQKAAIAMQFVLSMTTNWNCRSYR